VPADTGTGRARRAVRQARALWQLRHLPPRVARFQWRARRQAERLRDDFSLVSATRPRDLAILLRLAGSRRRVVELGTGTAWTAIALALADRRRQVVTFDPIARPEREAYLRLAGPQVASRIRLVDAPGERGPDAAEPVDLLYIDSSHDRESVIAEYRAWRAQLAPGAVVALDDYDHEDFPGIREAVAELRLTGERLGTLFVHRVP
jgi:predicted O-methyltransferase YrrM